LRTPESVVPGIVVAIRLCLVTPVAYLDSVDASRESEYWSAE